MEWRPADPQVLSQEIGRRILAMRFYPLQKGTLVSHGHSRYNMRFNPDCACALCLICLPLGEPKVGVAREPTEPEQDYVDL